MDMTGVKAGDEVRVFDVNGDRLGQPEGGWPGVVKSKGTKLFVVEWARAPHGEKFRLENGERDDSYGHQSVKTEAAARDDMRRKAATDTLRRCGLSFYSMGREALFRTEYLDQLADAAVDALTRSGGTP